MQNVNFKTIDEFLEFIPANELEIVAALRNLIFDCIPDCKEKLSYNVPFYRKHNTICFIWPQSIRWGNKVPNYTVLLGFTKGYLLQDELNYLDKGDRKQIYWKDFSDVKQIDFDLLKSYIFEAAMIDELSKKKIIFKFYAYQKNNSVSERPEKE